MTVFGKMLLEIKQYLAPGSTIQWIWESTGCDNCWTAACTDLRGQIHVTKEKLSGEEALRGLLEAVRGVS